jgi:hypothetical protein
VVSLGVGVTVGGYNNTISTSTHLYIYVNRPHVGVSVRKFLRLECFIL